jgi:hypothetical protein
MKKAILNRGLIIPILFIQLIPIILYPRESFSFSTQEWWLPVLLAFLTILGSIELAVRHNPEPWPWYLLSFSQGFNIISRLLMFMPRTIMNIDGTQVFNYLYISLTLVAIAISWFLLWYLEQPEVRMGIMPEPK